jgi:hypothetical protein
MVGRVKGISFLRGVRRCACVALPVLHFLLFPLIVATRCCFLVSASGGKGHPVPLPLALTPYRRGKQKSRHNCQGNDHREEERGKRCP